LIDRVAFQLERDDAILHRPPLYFSAFMCVCKAKAELALFNSYYRVAKKLLIIVQSSKSVDKNNNNADNNNKAEDKKKKKKKKKNKDKII